MQGVQKNEGGVSAHFARVHAAELCGIDARPVEVEVDVHVGLHSFSIVGLADKALSEARERVSSALKNSGVKPPTKENRKIVVNLAPADVKKTGSQYDVPIAIGYLLATNQIREFITHDKVFVGELSLDGAVRAISGALNIARMARARGMREVYVPAANAAEAALIEGIAIIPVRTLTALMAHVEGRVIIPVEPHAGLLPEKQSDNAIDVADIKGQESAKRALVIAASGGHHMLMSGSPGGGKTMLAQVFAGLLPPLSLNEVIEITQIYSAAGLLNNQSCVCERPFRAPHHTASEAAVVGGGPYPRPGEISLAHRGVLFLDELPEFHRDVLESLRQPLENGAIMVARSKQNLTFPARFMLIAAMNPCPCGYYGDTKKECSCGAHEVIRYQKKISGPILDRIDLQITVPRVELHELKKGAREGMTTKSAQEMVARARMRQYKRNSKLNADLNSKQCDTTIRLAHDAEKCIEKIWGTALLSARGYYRVLKVSQTIADIEGAGIVHEAHVAEAFNYRLREK